MSQLQVAVGVIEDAQGRILLARRAAHQHQGGLWEYPGGKIHAGETPQVALQRELHEELGIEAAECLPLISIPYDYADRHVRLHVFSVTRFTGTLHGREGQPLQWVARDRLHRYPVPPANRGITLALTLPERYLITPEPGDDWQVFLSNLGRSLARGVSLVQLRARSLSVARYRALAAEVVPLAREFPGVRVLLNSHEELVAALAADGVHLTAAQLLAARQRPLSEGLLVAASCHYAEDIQQAAALALDFIVLGPVQATTTHPDRRPLGWAGFAAVAAESPIPVYALGGMQAQDVVTARVQGAQGIAAISGLWSGDRQSLSQI